MSDERETYEYGFAQGYNAGFRAGLEAGKTIQPSNPLWNNKPYCKVCGMDFSKPMSYVCMHDKCPSKVTCFNNISYSFGTTKIT